MEGLLPDIRVLFEVILLDSLPANARIAALQHSDVRSMAQAADAVILENRASSELSRAAAEISSISRHDPDFLPDGSVAQPFAPVPSVNAVSSGASAQPRARRPPLRKADGICAIHNRYGKDAYKCLLPNSCKMSHIIATPPARPSSSGNGKAGGN